MTPGSIDKKRAKSILDQLDGKVKTRRAGILYQFWMLVVAILLILLPLVYLGMVAGVGYGVYLFATQGTAIITETHSKYGILLYLTPIVTGVLVVCFMVKPLLAKRSGQARPRRLTEADEPLLFEFVNRLCDVIRSPRPYYIQIDNLVNASASFHHGLSDLIRGRLTLTIGMPLVAGLNMQELTGVLAHEFGHFSQGNAMRVTYIVRRINSWFARLVYDRDEWDEKLAELSREIDIRIGFILWIARFVIWLTRRVLWVLMWVAHIVSSIMLRQMEFDADGYAARVTGTESFRRVEHKLRLLSVAEQKTQHDLSRAYAERRLGDNMPAMLVANLNTLDPELQERIIEDAMKEKTGLFDTHPAPKARIRHIEKLNEDGIFHEESESSLLFRHFDRYCREVTHDQFRAVFGAFLKECKIIPTQELIGSQLVEIDSRKAANRFFFGLLTGLRPFGFDPDLVEAPDNPREPALRLKRSRQIFMGSMDLVKESFKSYRESYQSEMRARVASMLIQTKVSFNAKDFGLNRAKPADVEQSLRACHRDCEDAEMTMVPFERAMFERMVSALKLLHAEPLRRRIPNADQLLAEARTMLSVLHCYEGIISNLRELLELFNGQKYLLSVIEQYNEDREYVNRVLSRNQHMLRHMSAIRNRFVGVIYPFEHGREGTHISDYLAEVVPADRESIGPAMHIADGMLDRLIGLYFRCVGVLADISEQVEKAAGLPSLEDVDKSEESQTEAAMA